MEVLGSAEPCSPGAETWAARSGDDLTESLVKADLIAAGPLLQAPREVVLLVRLPAGVLEGREED